MKYITHITYTTHITYITYITYLTSITYITHVVYITHIVKLIFQSIYKSWKTFLYKFFPIYKNVNWKLSKNKQRLQKKAR